MKHSSHQSYDSCARVRQKKKGQTYGGKKICTDFQGEMPRRMSHVLTQRVTTKHPYLGISWTLILPGVQKSDLLINWSFTTSVCHFYDVAFSRVFRFSHSTYRVFPSTSEDKTEAAPFNKYQTKYSVETVRRSSV